MRTAIATSYGSSIARGGGRHPDLRGGCVRGKLTPIAMASTPSISIPSGDAGRVVQFAETCGRLTGDIPGPPRAAKLALQVDTEWGQESVRKEQLADGQKLMEQWRPSEREALS